MSTIATAIGKDPVMHSAGSRGRAALRAGLGWAVAGLLAATAPAGAQTLDAIKTAGTLKIGYEDGARPFSFKDESGNPSGYAIVLCQQIVEEARTQLALPDLAVEWVPVAVADRFTAVSSGQVNLLCGAASETLSRREEVSFSIPIFPSGVGALLSSSSPVALRAVLTYGRPPDRPIWRGSPALTILEDATFSVVTGTTAEPWLNERLASFKLPAKVVPAASYEDGVKAVLDGSADVFFGDLPILLEAARANRGDLVVLDRHFTHETLAIVVPRADEDMRLLVDRALSRTYRGEGFRDTFTEWFGAPEPGMAEFFQAAALPE